MPRFDVQLKRTMVCTLTQWANVEVEADTEAEATAKAEKLATEAAKGEVVWEDHKGIPDDADPEEAKAYFAKRPKPKRQGA